MPLEFHVLLYFFSVCEVKLIQFLLIDVLLSSDVSFVRVHACDKQRIDCDHTWSGEKEYPEDVLNVLCCKV